MADAELPELLNDVSDAIRAKNLETARDRLDKIERIYDTIDATERQLQRQATVGRDSTETRATVRRRLDEYAQTAVSTDLARSSMLTAVTIYLADPSQTEASEIAQTLEKQANHERSLLDIESTVKDDIAEIQLDPTLLVATADLPTEPQPKGSSFEVPVTVQNVGDSAAEGVTLSVKSDISVSPKAANMGQIAPKSTEQVSFRIEADISGEFTLRLDVDGETGAADERTERFRILDKRSAIDPAREAVSDLIGHIEESENLKKGVINSLLSKLESAAAKLDHARDFLNRGKVKQANNMLRTAMRIIGAFLNQIDGLTHGNQSNRKDNSGDGKPLSLEEFQTLSTLGEGSIDRIALARTANT